MSWFSKTVPQRKWPDLTATLGLKLRTLADEWYPTFRRGATAHGLALPQDVTDTAKHYIHMLQLSAVGATLADNSYVSDLNFVLELIYTILTEKDPNSLRQDIASLPFTRAGDARKSLSLWAESMMRELSPQKDDLKLVDELKSYGALLVIQAKLATCEACGDKKGAEKVRQHAVS